MCVLEAEHQEVHVPFGLLRGQLFFLTTTGVDLAFHVWVGVRQRFPLTQQPSKALRTEAHLSYAVRVLACWPESEQEAAVLSFGRERGYGDWQHYLVPLLPNSGRN